MTAPLAPPRSGARKTRCSLPLLGLAILGTWTFAAGPSIDNFLADPAKSLVLNMSFTILPAASLNSASVSQQSPPEYGRGIPHLEIRFYDVHDGLLRDYQVPDPLLVNSYRAGGSHGTALQADAVQDIILPFIPDASYARFRDIRTDTVLATVDVKPTIAEYCIANPDDPDCFLADLSIESVGAVDTPPLVLLGQSQDYTIRSVLTNGGPDGPVDALFSQAVSGVSPGVSIDPANGPTDLQEAALAVDETREQNQVYTVTCQEPGLQSVTFSSDIRALSAAVIDPDESNDSKAFTLTVDCAVPVTLNNKPKSFPNSVSGTSSGDYPVAILTTEAGEYGNPIAFDAASIEAGSVNFGRPDLAAANLGATESHGKVHLKKSYELDDKTRDGDIDGVMHFMFSNTGLSSADSQACVKGSFYEGGSIYTFYGCDSVNVVN